MNFIFILKLILMSDINQLKHFDALDYKGEYFTNELNLKNLMVLFMIYMLLVKSLLVLIVLIPKFGKRIIKVLLGMVGYLNIKIIFLQVVILIDVALDGLT